MSNTAEISLPSIITAVANSEFEGFVAGTLYGQGWSIIFRALDAQSLKEFVAHNPEESLNALLIYSPDLPGFDPDFITQISKSLRQSVGFSPDAKVREAFPGVFNIPANVNELVSVVRGFVRAPMVRPTTMDQKISRRAKIIGIGSTSSGAGATTVAINLAMEISLLGRDVLLLDADVRRPSIAFLLALRNLKSESTWLTIAEHFSAGEITREHLMQFDEYILPALSTFDFIVIDLGSLEKISDSLTDRRWASTLIHWSCDNADELIFVGRADNLGAYRIGNMVKTFALLKIPAKINVLLNYKLRSRNSTERESSFLSAIAPLKPSRILTLPKDCRDVDNAQRESATLIDINERGLLRKAIAKIAVEVAG